MAMNKNAEFPKENEELQKLGVIKSLGNLT
jgi:hypothetical protein